MESTIYTVDGKTFELQHHGVKGMKWGRRKARPQSTGTGRRGGQAATDSAQSEAARKEARRAKAKRAAKIGAAVIAAGLAAYGAKKVHDVVRDKNYKFYVKQTSQMLESARKYGGFKSHAEYMDFAERSYKEAYTAAKNTRFVDAARNVYEDYQDQKRRR